MPVLSVQDSVRKKASSTTKWHDLLGSLLKELLTPLNISVQTDVRVAIDPRADILIIRRNGLKWSERQKVRLADGLRDSSASHLLIEFKYTESLNDATFRQILAYEYFYQKGQVLKQNELQSFLISAKTPTSGILKQRGFKETDKKGVYASALPWAGSLRVILLNALSDEPHNAFLKCFSSRRIERRKAFTTIKHSWSFKISMAGTRLISGLRRLLMEKAVEDPEVVGYTPEYVMQLGQEWIEAAIDAMPVEEVLQRFKPEERLAGMRPEEVLKHFKLEERVSDFSEQMITLKSRKAEAVTMLTRLLERRFGDVPDWAHEEMTKADLDTLEEWSLRVLDAGSFDVIFEK